MDTDFFIETKINGFNSYVRENLPIYMIQMYRLANIHLNSDLEFH